jgi:hypothetical protein
MNPDFFNSSSNQSQTPDTIQDFIDLLIATKEKYGNLKVRRVFTKHVLHPATHLNDDSEYYEIDDVVVTHSPQSLIRDTKRSESYLLLVT